MLSGFKRTREIYPKIFVFICFFNICIPKYPFIRFINMFSYNQYFWFIWINFKFYFVANEEAILSIVCRSESDSTIRATSSAYNNAFIIWEAIGTPILCSESISVRSFIITEKSEGDKIHPCFTPLSLLSHSVSRSPRTTLLLTVLHCSFSKRHTFSSTPLFQSR